VCVLTTVYLALLLDLNLAHGDSLLDLLDLLLDNSSLSSCCAGSSSDSESDETAVQAARSRLERQLHGHFDAQPLLCSHALANGLLAGSDCTTTHSAVPAHLALGQPTAPLANKPTSLALNLQQKNKTSNHGGREKNKNTHFGRLDNSLASRHSLAKNSDATSATSSASAALAALFLQMSKKKTKKHYKPNQQTNLSLLLLDANGATALFGNTASGALALQQANVALNKTYTR
jgi:hypothetical protein